MTETPLSDTQQRGTNPDIIRSMMYQLLRFVTPITIASFLYERGWIKVGKKEIPDVMETYVLTPVEVWRIAGMRGCAAWIYRRFDRTLRRTCPDDNTEIIIPSRNGYDRYVDLILPAIQTVSHIEQRDADFIVVDLLTRHLQYPNNHM